MIKVKVKRECFGHLLDSRFRCSEIPGFDSRPTGIGLIRRWPGLAAWASLAVCNSRRGFFFLEGGMAKATCATCAAWRRISDDNGECRLNPSPIGTGVGHWCAQHRVALPGVTDVPSDSESLRNWPIEEHLAKILHDKFSATYTRMSIQEVWRAVAEAAIRELRPVAAAPPHVNLESLAEVAARTYHRLPPDGRDWVKLIDRDRWLGVMQAVYLHLFPDPNAAAESPQVVS